MDNLVYQVARSLDFGAQRYNLNDSLESQLPHSSNKTLPIGADVKATTSDSSNNLWLSILAFILTTAGSFFTALSFTLMKYSINRN